MMAKTDLNYDILIEAQREDVDHYFNLLKTHGWFDFVDDFIEPELHLEGVRIDTEWNYPRTIKVPQIHCENTLSVLGQLKELKKDKY
jgi:hypothetical protein